MSPSPVFKHVNKNRPKKHPPKILFKQPVSNHSSAHLFLSDAEQGVFFFFFFFCFFLFILLFFFFYCRSCGFQKWLAIWPYLQHKFTCANAVLNCKIHMLPKVKPLSLSKILFILFTKCVSNECQQFLFFFFKGPVCAIAKSGLSLSLFSPS